MRTPGPGRCAATLNLDAATCGRLAGRACADCRDRPCAGCHEPRAPSPERRRQPPRIPAERPAAGGYNHVRCRPTSTPRCSRTRGCQTTTASSRLEAPEIAAVAQPGPVRDGQAARGHRSAAAAAVLDLRGPARRRRRADRRSRSSTNASASARRCSTTSSRAHASRASDHWAGRSSRSIRRRRPGWWPAASAWRRL